jgi:hypothetical protein
MGLLGEAVGFLWVGAAEPERWDSPLPPVGGEPERRRFEGVGFIKLSIVSLLSLCRNIYWRSEDYLMGVIF